MGNMWYVSVYVGKANLVFRELSKASCVNIIVRKEANINLFHVHYIEYADIFKFEYYASIAIFICV